MSCIFWFTPSIAPAIISIVTVKCALRKHFDCKLYSTTIYCNPVLLFCIVCFVFTYVSTFDCFYKGFLNSLGLLCLLLISGRMDMIALPVHSVSYIYLMYSIVLYFVCMFMLSSFSPFLVLYTSLSFLLL